MGPALAASLALACSSSGGGSNGGNGTQGPPGPQGPPGTSVAPSLAGVTPRVLLLDREVDVVIVGNATTFTGMEMPDFGAGVGVFNVTLISPTALGAHLKIDKAAAVGTRDLHVAQLTAAGAFLVAPPVDVSVLAGTPAQGGLAYLDVRNRDPDNDFNTALSCSPAFCNGSYAGFGFAPDPAEGDTPLYMTPTEARLVVQFDPLAPTGSAQLIAEDVTTPLTVAGTVVTTYESSPGVLSIAAKTPSPLMAGMPVSASLAGSSDNAIYRFTSDGTTQLVAFTVTPSMATSHFAPRVSVYAAGGLAADRYPDPAPLTNTAVDLYVSVADAIFPSSAATDFSYTITAKPVAATLASEQSSPHGTMATAQNLATYSQPIVLTGTLSAGLEQDWYTIGSLPAPPTCWRLAVTAKAAAVDVELSLSIVPGGVGAFATPFHPSVGGSVCINPNGATTATSTLLVRSTDPSSTGSYVVGLEPE